ncbi:MAG: response regulator [Actinobacteria bacterium]|nr:response regulator [Actinomycetota bacterium]
MTGGALRRAEEILRAHYAANGPLTAAEGDQSTAASVEAVPPVRHRSLLCIDDNASNVKLIERLVRRRPAIKLLVAHDGAGGLGLAREHVPDAILLDLNLPDISGQDLLRQIKTDPALAAIPVIMVSADATPGRIEPPIGLAGSSPAGPAAAPVVLDYAGRGGHSSSRGRGCCGRRSGRWRRSRSWPAARRGCAPGRRTGKPPGTSRRQSGATRTTTCGR